MSWQPTTTESLRERLLTFTVSTVEALERAHLPRWRLPRTFAGHAVAADVRADLCFTLTHLAAAGVTEVAGDPIDDVLRGLLAEVDGPSTHTFFSYRIAETLQRLGPFAGNPLLEGFDERQLQEVERAVDSSDWLELLDGGHLPRNYNAVLARCELGRVRLGLADDETRLNRLLARTMSVLGANRTSALDDSNQGTGRYDIYSADVWLFTEPLGWRLGNLWRNGLRHALDLVLVVGSRDGSAVPWGRSVGDLSAALTLELGALALAGGHAAEAGTEAVWLRRASDAADTVLRGFGSDGVSTAHQHRAQDGYRGPARRLQLTFDLLGKVAWAALALGEAPALEAAPVAAAYPTHDRWWAFEQDRPAGVWSHGAPGARAVVPFVGASRSHYLPAPFEPGTWEVPIDRDLPTWSPLIVEGIQRHTAAALPTAVEHDEADGVRATWTGFPISGRGLDGEDVAAPFPGTRTAHLWFDGRTLVLDDSLTFDRVPAAVSLAVPEVPGRPLHVTFETEAPHLVSRIDVDGLAEWRSATGGFTTVHQLDLEPASELRYRVRATPLLRVASTEPDHHYATSLYRTIRDRAVIEPPPIGWRAPAVRPPHPADLLHVHWPEWVGFDDPATHDAILAELADLDMPIVWTAHNLTPHEKRPEVYDAIYARWAAAAAGVIHHTAWGEAIMRARYDFAPGCRHEVIPHGHFGALWTNAGLPPRDEAERRLGLAPAALRIGVVGAPRAEKLVQEVLDGVAACAREDVQLVCWSLGPDDRVPDDPRIAIAEPYRQVDKPTYAARLATCDVLALVFDPDGEMLATGAAADAIGLGLPALRSDWGYLVETLGGSGVPVGHTADSIAAALDALDRATLDQARAAAELRKAELDWTVLGPRTADLFERVVQRLP